MSDTITTNTGSACCASPIIASIHHHENQAANPSEDLHGTCQREREEEKGQGKEEVMFDPRPHACPKCRSRDRVHNTIECSRCGANVTPEGIFVPPVTPTMGKIMVQQLEPKLSKIIEVVTIDRADETESVVVALSPCQYGVKYSKRGGWSHTGATFPHEVHLFDRVVHEGCYQDDSFLRLNGVKYRFLEPREIKGIIHAEQPKGFENPTTGEVMPDKHPIHILGA